MDRTVPKTGSEDIELYMRTYYSLLRSTHTILLETLVEAHMAMDSSLHVRARNPEPDVSALVYTSLRLPSCMLDVDYVLLGQIEKSFLDSDYPVTEWERVYAPGRRRRMHFDGERTLAVFIASRSDIDDLIPMLTAYQIEWNKLTALLQNEIARLFLAQNQERTTPLSESERAMLSTALEMDPADLERLEMALGKTFVPTLRRMAAGRKSIGVRQIAGSLADYRRATAYWWDDLTAAMRSGSIMKPATDAESTTLISGSNISLEDRPVYFVSSNTHSLLNLLSGFAQREEANLIDYMDSHGHEKLVQEYRAILANKGTTNKNNFLYFA